MEQKKIWKTAFFNRSDVIGAIIPMYMYACLHV